MRGEVGKGTPQKELDFYNVKLDIFASRSQKSIFVGSKLNVCILNYYTIISLEVPSQALSTDSLILKTEVVYIFICLG